MSRQGFMETMSGYRYIIKFFLILFLLAGCFVDIEDAPCKSSDNCPKRQYCSMIDQKCHKTDFKGYSCEDSECGENEFCYPLDKKCHLKDELGLPCDTYFDCPSGQLCSNSNCEAPGESQCKKDEDCLKKNVQEAICDGGVCKIKKCSLGFEDKDIDYSNGCEEVLPCSDDGLDYYAVCNGNNECKCNATCIKLAKPYGVNYDKGECLTKCAPTDVNKSFEKDQMCICTTDELGTCKKANLFQTGMLIGTIRAKIGDNCDDFGRDSALFGEIKLELGGEVSYYNRGFACYKTENNKPIINVSLFKICNVLPCKDVISISLPENISSNQTLKFGDGGEASAMKASLLYDMVNNLPTIKELWINATSVAGSVIVENNGKDANKIIQLNISLKLLRYDVPLCGDIVNKTCTNL